MASADSYLSETDNAIYQTSRLKDDFEDIKKIGRGGFGIVYKAKNRLDGRIYAIKRVKIWDKRFPLSKETQEKVIREVKALAVLFHPYIVRYYHAWKESRPSITSIMDSQRLEESISENIDCKENLSEDSLNITMDNVDIGKDDEDDVDWIEFRSSSEERNRKRKSSSDYNDDNENMASPKRSRENPQVESLFITMEFCSGMDLEKWMYSTPKRDLMTVAKMFLQILEAVKYIHSKNYVHRDLKPSNIYLAENGNIKIGDFGCVKECIFDPEEAFCQDLEKHTSGEGTSLYQSPELLQSEPYSYPVDIYALGVIWFELLFPFPESSQRYKILRNVNNRVFPHEFSQKFSTEHSVMMEMLAEDPLKRPTAADILERLNFTYFNYY